ncbi:insulinase family protein [Altererythrobacter sp. RZ02]|uniref:Insulinase family protein n=1 Tax=Pontixanthobacter rizhaonensis TaxID=2730337 RepID=A0A848QGT2_9SPHN|nr:insulinase family protein [Pontixanthobacter rizhaonensis]NMW31822.1 insulinase family protein [Pontixanthobacter rizhaonensis]
MIKISRAVRPFVCVLPALLLAGPIQARTPVIQPPALDYPNGGDIVLPVAAQTGDETPWIYEGSDVPRDEEWLFGKMDNGLRYAVRENGVPPDQVSIRIRLDVGSLHEEDSEQGFAHLMEHLSFRESKYLKAGEAITRWQELGATFGSDTNAETSPTHTVYKLDLPNATPAALEESFKLLSGMMREPVLSDQTLAAEIPIVLAEKRERGGAAQRVAEKSRQILFTGQRLANRLPIGTEATLKGATGPAMQAFHDRWYRPENAVVVVAGDTDAITLALLVEKYFGDWQGKGPLTPEPNFGDPVAPAGADAANPVGEVAVIVEPDLPRSMTYAIMRPWRPVQDTIVYNEGLLIDTLSQAIINRRLESRARSGGSFLYAQVSQDDVSRSTDATFVSVGPLDNDWQSALRDVRGVIADALATPPTMEEINREVAEFDSIFVSQLEQADVQAGSALADNVIQAVDIREAIAAPDTVLKVFRGMKAKITPEAVLKHTRALFKGDVIRGTYLTPQSGEADEGSLRAALLAPAEADGSARLAAKSISFDELPPIGEPGTIVSRASLGVTGIPEIERIEFANGARALIWSHSAERGRVSVKMRFGSGYRGFGQNDAAYISLAEMALIGSGLGDLGQEELDRISTGRVLGFDFGIGDGNFTFGATTRNADLADQLYLFAGKLAMPRWDVNPVNRAKAAQRLAYESYATSPGGVLGRDLEYILRNNDERFSTPTPEELAAATPEGFRAVWEPLLKQGDVEVIIFGDFDKEQAVEALRKTVGALPPRDPIPADVAARIPSFPQGSSAVKVLTHRGDANQAAAVIAWPSGGGVAGLPESRQLDILVDVFNNRLIDAMRERAGASYAPNVGSRWPVEINGGGRVTAIAQLRPQDVPVFYAAAEAIAQDLVINPPTAEELQRVTEPLRQLINRASTGNQFWVGQLEGSSSDPRRIRMVRSLLSDYTQTSAAAMQFLAKRYFTADGAYRIAIIPEGQKLASETGSSANRAAEIIGR